MDMTSEGLGDMFEGDSADTCGGKFPLVSMGAEQRVYHAQTREQGPPSAPADFVLIKLEITVSHNSDHRHLCLPDIIKF